MDITIPYFLTKSVCEAKMTSHHRVHVGKQVQNDSVLMNIIYTVKQIWTSRAFEHSDLLKSSPGVILCQLATL